MPSEDIRISKKFNNIHENSEIPTIRDTELARQEAVDGTILNEFIKNLSHQDPPKETIHVIHFLMKLNIH